MKRLTAALCAGLLAAPSLAAEYRPAACSNAAEFMATYDCPSPYVELQPPPEGDAVFSQVWQCLETKYAIGMVKREHGNDREACASAGTIRWTLPADSDSAFEYLTAEIDANVVNPCLLVQIKSEGSFSDLDDKAVLTLVREMHPENVQAMRDAIRPLVETKDFAGRRTVYSNAREFCGVRRAPFLNRFTWSRTRYSGQR